MSPPMASPSLHLAPPPENRPRVEIGCACSPGAVVRMPVEGIYYETLPANLGADADWLQAALLGCRASRPAPARPRLLTWLSMIGVLP
jgi:hypothetical protein